MKVLYEGKTKKVIEGPEPGTVIIEFSDQVTAFNGRKRKTLRGKGKLCCDMSCALFSLLESRGLRTHFIKRLKENSFLAHKVKIISLEVVVRNRAAGAAVKRLGLEKGTRFSQPLLELFLKSDALGDPLVCSEHVLEMKVTDPDTLNSMKQRAAQANSVLEDLFAERGLILADIKFEFGTTSAGELVLADELSPDCMRLWDAATGQSLDKDVFREGKGDLVETYRQVADRLGIHVV